MHQASATTTEMTSTEFTGITENTGTSGKCSNKRCQRGCPLPYSYAARPQRPRNSDEKTPCYLSDSLCGLLTYLRRECIDLSSLEFISLTNTAPEPVNARLYQIIDGHWQDKRYRHQSAYQA